MAPATRLPIQLSTRLPARLQQIAGWALVVICGAHIALFAVQSRDVAAGWLLGDFRNGTGTLASEALFWALPGGFALPLLVLAGVIVSLARRRIAIPSLVPYGLTVWVAINVIIVPASGFMAGVVPCGLLIWADLLGRRRSGEPVEEPVRTAPGSPRAAG